MGKRAAIALPIWGISAIAVGSIGAPLPREMVAETRGAQHAATQKLAKVEPHPTPAKGAKHRFARLTMPPRESGRLPIKRETVSGALAATVAAVPAIPLLVQKPIATADLPSASAVPQPLVSATPAVAASAPASTVVPPKVTVLPGAATPKAPESAPVVQQAVPVRGAVGEVGQRDSRSLDGTGARNAYKVYFPQIDEPASAVAKRFDDVAAAQGDDRVLRKDSDGYFHYDRPEKASSSSAGAKADKAAATKPKERSLDVGVSADASVQKQIDSLIAAKQQRPPIQ